MGAYHLVVLILGILLLGPVVAPSPVTAQEEPNVGLLRVAELTHPRQVVPGAQFSFAIDVEYAVRFNATIRAALFDGSPSKLGEELWHSEEEMVEGGGDKVWTVVLTAPQSEQDWHLTAYAYYLEDGRWESYNDTYRGLGYSETSLKVAKLAILQVDLGIPNVSLSIDSSNLTTSATGSAEVHLPVGVTYSIRLPVVVSFQNSTRFIFVGWEDGTNTTDRALLLDGDIELAGFYKVQYLLRVDSVLSAYSFSRWYDSGSNVTLQAAESVPMSGPFQILGSYYRFKGWSGDVKSKSAMVNFTMDGPKAISADYAIDYTPLALPSIFALGILGGIVLFLFARRRRRPVDVVSEEAQPTQESRISAEARLENCPKCGATVERDWTHCTNCGQRLASSEPGG